MLFSSPEFLFAFLPLVFVGFVLCHRLKSRSAVMYWLIASSLFFYGWWNPRYLALIAVLIAANFGLARAIAGAGTLTARKAWLVSGLVLNLGTLIYYKYTHFLLQNVNAVSDAHFFVGTIVLPLGISFFTFQKIAFLVDTYHGRVQRIGIGEYGLFVLFFPQLIAGPIVHHAEVVPQFRQLQQRHVNVDNIAIGLSVFAIGLFKKVVLADSLSAYDVTPVFSKVAAGGTPLFIEAWAGTLGYTLQLYFDFSGYSDMAIGSALLFGIRLPQNFHSPYKAHSIIDFWRRWHMTLSRFLRDYVYYPLGGNRLGPLRRYVNLFITMLLGGIWHGAGWTFVIWGALHGSYLTLNHGWRAATDRWHLSFALIPRFLRRACALGLTFLAVVVGWVFFKSDSVATAARMLRAMSGANGMQLPKSFARLPLLRPLLGHLVQFQPGAEAYGQVRGSTALAGIAILLAWVWLLPNAQQIFAQQNASLATRSLEPAPKWAQFFFGWRWVALISISLFICLLYVQSNIAQDFLYFDF
jgi:alginate O-acetyltransferase complex protein AlgI